MARKANGKRFCKFVVVEDGRRTIVESRGDTTPMFPNNVNHPQVPYSGVHLAEMLMNPREPQGCLTKREAILIVFSLFCWELISILAQEVAYALT